MHLVIWQRGPFGNLYAVPSEAGILPDFALVGVSVLGDREARVTE